MLDNNEIYTIYLYDTSCIAVDINHKVYAFSTLKRAREYARLVLTTSYSDFKIVVSKVNS
jgi:hypothetical protein